MTLVDLIRLNAAAYSKRPPKVDSLDPVELPKLPEMRPLGAFFPVSCLELYISPLMESMNETWCEYFTQLLRQIVYQVGKILDTEFSLQKILYNLITLK